MNTAEQAADQVIADIKASGGPDYSAAREDIIKLFDETLWNGNWDATTDLDGGLRNLRFIQEDEFDQHMDDGPEHEEQICYTEGHYVFYAD
jgi:hypothetical protein